VEERGGKEEKRIADDKLVSKMGGEIRSQQIKGSREKKEIWD